MDFDAFGKNLLKLFDAKAGAAQPKEPTTRWEKAVAAMKGISQQVAKIDPDGIDVYCFPGEGCGVEKYDGIKDVDALYGMVADKTPSGPCRMSEALNMAFAAAASRGEKRPCSMLVITAGRPDDEAQVVSAVQRAVSEQAQYLSITFVHVGDDPAAEAFLKHLDENLVGTSSEGAPVDIVDTVKDEEIRTAMEEMRDPNFKSGMAAGALLGAMAGMAIGAGGAYYLAKHNAEKRTAGWNGKWEVLTQPGDAASGIVLDVKDDLAGNLEISGYPEGEGCPGEASAVGSYENSHEGYIISRQIAGPRCANGCGRRPFQKFPTCCTHCKGTEGPHARDCAAKAKKVASLNNVSGNAVDEHLIEWSDGTSWREVPPEGASWGLLGGSAAAGALAGLAAGGGVGALTQKHFFNKAASRTPADYVIILDRSAQMALQDSGPGHR